MNRPRSKSDVLDREFLVMRAKVLELAAALDRLDRAPGDLHSPEQRDLVRKGIELLLQETAPAEEPNRAEQIQLLFSRDYAQGWRDDFKL